LCAESRNLGSLVSDLLLVQSIKASLNSCGLVVELVVKSQEGVLDLVAVGSNLLTDIIQSSHSLASFHTLLITSAAIAHRLHSISSRGSCICRVGRPAIRVSRSTGPVTQSASDYSG
jgi:chromosome condensin MukBEF ATPase and DNA-binding subunit MukB